MAGNQAVINTKLTADGSELTRALNQGIAKATDFRGQMMNLGKTIGAAFTVQALASYTKAIVELADDIVDVAGSLNISTTSLQAFDAVARKSVADVDGFRMGMKKLAEVQADAANGNATAQKSFDRLGMGTAGYTASLDSVVKSLADYYAATNDMATVQDLFGKQAVKSREALLEIAQQTLPELKKAMTDAGLVIDKEGLRIVSAWDNMWKEMQFRGKKYGVDLVDDFKYTMDAIKTGLRFNFDEKFEGRLIEGQRTQNPAQLLTTEQRAARQELLAAQKKAADDIAAYEEDHHNAAYEEELERINKLGEARRAAADDAARSPVNEQYGADIAMMQAKLYMEQEAADIRKESIEKAKAAEEELADKIKKHQSDAFDWAVALAESDLSARTPGQRPDAEWFGSALNRVGAIGSVKGSSPEMQLSKDQLATLKKIADYVAPIKNLAIGTFVGGQ